MKWLEIITLRSPEKINRQLLDELLEGVRGSDVSSDPSKLSVEIRIYHHSVFETDLSIHMYWNSERGWQDKSPLGLRFSSALRNLGLINHSVWVETTFGNVPLVIRRVPRPLRQGTGAESSFSTRATLKGQR